MKSADRSSGPAPRRGRKTGPRRSPLPGPSSPPLGLAFPPGGLPAALTFHDRPTVLRLLRADDSARLIAFFESHTEDTIRSRYGYLTTWMSPERAATLVGVNQAWDAALGLFETDGGTERLVAVGRCCRETAQDTAEIAFVVHEARRGLGMATTLFRSLATLMRQRGVTRLVAQVQQDNGPMLALFRHAGATFVSRPGTDVVNVSLTL